MKFGRIVWAVSCLAACAVGALAAPINYSSNPFTAFQGDVWIEGQPSSGTFTLTSGVAQTESVWLYDAFWNPTATFSGETALLDLNLNGIDHQIPFLVSATAWSGAYTFTANGTVSYDLAGIGIVDVTGISVTTGIYDPLHAGPTQASFYLEPSDVPEPLTLSLFGAGLAGVFAARRRARK